MKQYSAIFFDLDDTLFNEIDYIKSGFLFVSKYLEEIINVDYMTINKDLLSMYYIDKNNLFDQYLQKFNIGKSVINDNCIQLYRTHPPKIQMSEDMCHLLKELKNNNYKLGIITDGRPIVQRNKIKALQLEEIFDEIIITDELGGSEFRKPCEVPYVQLCRLLDVNAIEAVYIGNNPACDFLTPNKMNMDSILIYNKHSIPVQDELLFPIDYRPVYKVNSIDEIREIIFAEGAHPICRK